MDRSSFDALARSLTGALAGTTTRRGITQLLGGLALGGPLALLRRGEADAKCKKKCGPCKRCKKGKCKKKAAGTACPGGTCQGGACVPATASPPPPPAPLTCAEVCGANCGMCFTLADGGTACGDFGSDCAAGETCLSTADCPAGKVCATSLTNRRTNVTSQFCDQPVGSGVCWRIAACF
jgi:hypothetical protein